MRHKRNEILLSLTESGIGSSVYYPQPVPRMRYYNEKYNTSRDDYKNAETISDGSVALPVGPHLNTNDMNIIADYLCKILEGCKK